MIPIAAFLAGALLSLLLPTLLLIALVVWYLMLARRVPEPETADPRTPLAPPNPGPSAPPAAGSPPGES